MPKCEKKLVQKLFRHYPQPILAKHWNMHGGKKVHTRLSMWKQPSVHSLHKVFLCCGSWGSCYSFMNADGFYRTTSAYCLLHNVTMEMFSRKDSLIKCPFIAALLNLRLSLFPRHPPTWSYIESLMWNHRTWKVGGIPVPPAVSQILSPTTLYTVPVHVTRVQLCMWHTLRDAIGCAAQLHMGLNYSKCKLKLNII